MKYSGRLLEVQQSSTNLIEIFFTNVSWVNTESMRKLRRLLTEIMEGGRIPDEWKKSRVALIYKGGGEQELKNYRPIAIINVTCKMCMMMIKERLNNWMEETNFLGDIQCGFRRNRRTEDNMFMLERMMEMAAARGEELYIAFYRYGKGIR